MKTLIAILVVAALATSCFDQNGVIEAMFRLRPDSPLPSWLLLPAGFKPKDAQIAITDYEATTMSEWKVKFVIRDKATGQRLPDVMGIGYWHPDSERVPQPIYPNWIVIQVNGIKDVYQQSEANDLLKIVKKP